MANNKYQICTTMMKDGKQHISDLNSSQHKEWKMEGVGVADGYYEVYSWSTVREQACMCGHWEESSLGVLTNNLQSLKTS